MVFVIDCISPFDVIAIPGTTIISPNYPSDYGYNLDCQVTLAFPERVSIAFKAFDVGLHCYDWLEVIDGNSSDSELIGSKLCGSDIPTPIQSNKNSLTLVFHSSGSKNYKGFELEARQGML